MRKAVFAAGSATIGWKDLNGDGTIQTHVAGLVDDPHCAFADRRADPIVVQYSAGRQHCDVANDKSLMSRRQSPIEQVGVSIEAIRGEEEVRLTGARAPVRLPAWPGEFQSFGINDLEMVDQTGSRTLLTCVSTPTVFSA